MPGFSSARVPAQSAGLHRCRPVAWRSCRCSGIRSIRASTHRTPPISACIFSESLIGVMYGMLARLYTLGLQFAASVVAMMVGYTQPSAADIFEDSAGKQPFRLHHLRRHDDPVHDGLSSHRVPGLGRFLHVDALRRRHADARHAHLVHRHAVVDVHASCCGSRARS